MEETDWTPSGLLQLSGGYWSACALHAAVKLDVFTPLSAVPRTAADLAGVVNADPRGLEMLLNALAAMGLAEKETEIYRATAFSSVYLCRTSPDYMGHIILHHHYLMDSWSRLDVAVAGGGPVRKPVAGAVEADVRESFEMGMYNLAMQVAPTIVSGIDLSGRRRLLDLGGGPGTYAVHFCRANPEVSAVVFDLPSTSPFAENTIARFGLSDRISFVPGDFITDEIDGSFDVAWLSHILHSAGPEQCSNILRKAVRCLEPGGLLLVQEFVMNDSLDGPLFPALFSLNMLVGTENGRSYSEAELKDMMSTAGASDLRRLPFELPNDAGVIVGTVGR